MKHKWQFLTLPSTKCLTFCLLLEQFYYDNKNAGKKPQQFSSKKIIESFLCWVPFRKVNVYLVFGLPKFTYKSWVVSKSNKKALTYFLHNNKQCITYSNPFSIVSETNICRYFESIICCNINCGGFNHPFVYNNSLLK